MRMRPFSPLQTLYMIARHLINADLFKIGHNNEH
jgi:hypothetical protein